MEPKGNPFQPQKNGKRQKRKDESDTETEEEDDDEFESSSSAELDAVDFARLYYHDPSGRQEKSETLPHADLET